MEQNSTKEEDLSAEDIQKVMDEIKEDRSQKGLPPLSHRDLMQEAISRLT